MQHQLVAQRRRGRETYGIFHFNQGGPDRQPLVTLTIDFFNLMRECWQGVALPVVLAQAYYGSPLTIATHTPLLCSVFVCICLYLYSTF